MTEQFSLPGIDPAPLLTDRLLFGVFPDVSAAVRATRCSQHLCREHELSGELLATDRLHVTLYHIGDYVDLPKGIVTAAREAAATLAVAPFEVTFDRAGSFFRQTGDLPFVLLGNEGVAALTAFQRVLFEALKKSGLARGAKSSFTPHMTLLYDRRNIAVRPIEPLSWTVREFVLVRSLLRQTRHIPLECWPLRG